MVVEMIVERTLRIVFEDDSGEEPFTNSFAELEFERLHTMLCKKLKDGSDVEIHVAREKILNITRGGTEVHNAE